MSVERLSTMLIQKIEHVYQPIWSADSLTVFGYEALVRFPINYYEGSIERVFEWARTEGTFYDLDTRSITEAIARFSEQHWDNELLFLNVYPSTLIHMQFPAFLGTLLNTFPDIRGKVVLELSEAIEEDYCWELPIIKERIAYIKEMGFLVALDDVGKGGSGLQRIIEFSPDYLKLDRYFSMELSSSIEKQQMLALFLTYATNKMVVILEGLEEDIDLQQAQTLMVPLVQGYLLGRPQKLTTQKTIREVKPTDPNGRLHQ
ncbi:EAL domain-containing protein [Neobacillus jeddahensis]|uniref:EAL domain-containing protein n=1 Tax=Neobacillus jeddahensis TaxID=1461580 RepID=UPI000AC09541|nr:EAL domain-containing protein [Neobacillus jeddahensis]